MTSLSRLLEDLVSVLQRCPEIVSELDDPEAVLAYQDVSTSIENSLMRATYMQPNGTVMIAWQTSGITEGEMEGWGHQVDIYCRAQRQRSPLALLNAVIDGVPEGDTIRWRYICINDDVLPVEIQEIARLTDEEAVDYYVIRSLFKEKGDTSNGVSGQ